MFKVKVKPIIMYHSFEYLLKNPRIGANVNGSGDKIMQYAGIICENVVNYALFNKLIPLDKTDSGYDIEINHKKVDIKSMSRKDDPQLNSACNFMARQRFLDADYYLFTSLNRMTNEMTVCGYISKDDFLIEAELYYKGSERTRRDGTSFILRADNYEIKINQLVQVNNWRDVMLINDPLKLGINPMYVYSRY